MHIVKRLTALSVALLVLMMTSACAEASFLVHSFGWNWTGAPVEVLLKADVETHMPFDDDRLAMLTPITDMLSMRLVTGEDMGSVSLLMEEEELLTLVYSGNEAQFSCVPDTTYQAKENPLTELLGTAAAVGSVYDMLGLSPRGESLVTDGRMMAEHLPAVLEKYGKRSANTTNISGYGQAAYRYDYTVNANQMDDVKQAILDVCPEGWLREIISSLVFSGKQTLRMYYAADDVLLRAEYNGSCGPEDSLRTVKLVYKLRHDEEMDKDYIELTSPAKKGKDKNNLTFERTVATNKKGQRTITAEFNYTAIADGVTSVRKGDISLINAFEADHDVITGTVTLESKLNGAEKYDALTLAPSITISGTADAPVVSGSLALTEKYAGKVTEKADIAIDLKPAAPVELEPSFYAVDLSLLDDESIALLRQEIADAVTTAIVRPLILKMGAEADWFFRDLPEEAVQGVIDAAEESQ